MEGGHPCPPLFLSVQCNIMRLRLKATSKSVRIPPSLQPIIGRKIARITLNPVLYRRSQEVVKWTRDGTGSISPQTVLLRAVQCYPRLSLSNAVEAVLLDSLLQHAAEKGQQDLSETARIEFERFRNLSPSDKIRITKKRISLSRYLKSLPQK
jgi:hypothetical protein